MTDLMSQDRLEAVLTSIGEHLELGDAKALAAVRPVPLRRKPRPALVAAAVVVVIATVLVIAPARTAIAEWLGIGSTRIDIVSEEQPVTDGLSSIIDGLLTIPIDEAEALLGRPLPDTSNTVLGEADHVVAMPEGGVTLVWTEGETTLWIHTTESADGSISVKLIGPDAATRPIDDLGEDALIIEGDHLLETPQRRLAAGTVLLWIRSGLDYRLESNLAQTTMIEIARIIDSTAP